ncbi:archaeosortase family protein ArtE [Methanocaldococcus indicus]|uniref:archaeosortase family protein ArtE n=1 Tax=Methanocaldococcus indicus TaxID=213231 RepID=UPI003C6D1D47
MKKDIYIIGKIVKFYIIFFLIFLVLNYFSKYLVDIVSLLVFHILNLLYSAKLINSTIILPNCSITIVKECSGAFLYAVFLSLLVYAKNIKHILIGLFLLILSFWINILRIVLIGIFLEYRFPKYIHDVVGYLLIVLSVPTLSFLYLKAVGEIK